MRAHTWPLDGFDDRPQADEQCGANRAADRQTAAVLAQTETGFSKRQSHAIAVAHDDLAKQTPCAP